MLTTRRPERERGSGPEGGLTGSFRTTSARPRYPIRYRGPTRGRPGLRYVRLITSVKMSVCPSGLPAEVRPSVHTGYRSDPPTAIAL